MRNNMPVWLSIGATGLLLSLGVSVGLGQVPSPTIAICVEAHEMKPRVSEARGILESYVVQKQSIALWTLMKMANVMPTDQRDEIHLGNRKPFAMTGNADGKIKFASAMGDSIDCPNAAPLCSQGTFPLEFGGKTGTARASFPRAMAATIADGDPLVVDLGDGVPVKLSGVGLPPNVVLRTIELGTKTLRYWLDVGLTGHPTRAHVDMLLEGACSKR